MQITIFSGGSGSEELQKGLYNLFKNYVKVFVIINGYDDGKSTGIVRKIYDNKILGPSDLRKNHLIKHYLQYGKETSIYRFLNHRFTSNNPKEYCIEMLKQLKLLEYNEFFIECINNFFDLENSKKYKYQDFSIGNIIYSYLLYNEGCTHTCEIMSKILKIPNEVFFQSSEVLKLKGRTYSEYILETENDIVSFNSSDKIKDVFLEDLDGNIKIPTLSTFVVDIILASDILIFSSGTQWSSLIPTYMSINFSDVIKKSKAKKYLIMNLCNDKDMQGYIGEEYLKLLNTYLSLNDINLIYSSDSIIDIPISTLNQNKYLYLIFNDIQKNDRHNGDNLTLQLFMDYYSYYMTSTLYVFDYDYTIYDPNKIELSNMILDEIYKLKFKKMILSANDYNNIKVDFSKIDVISNQGCIYYPKTIINIRNILKENEIQKIIDTLETMTKTYNISKRIISIAIKPVLNRDQILLELKKSLPEFDIVKTGKTTIEIMKKNISKFEGLKYIINKFNKDSVQYISDEDDLRIRDPEDNIYKFKKLILSQEECYMYLKILNNRKRFLPDLLIVAGGMNTRMHNNIPKLLENIDSKTCLEHIYNNSHNFISNLYILTNAKYYDFFTGLGYKVIKCYQDNMLPSESNFPRGNLETLISGLKSIDNVKNDCLIIWSDCVPKDSRIFGELIDKKGSFIIPTQLEKDPYAYILGTEKYVKEILFRKNDPIEIGYHDMSIFKMKLSVIKNIGEKLLRKNEIMNKEPHIFDLIPYLYKIENFATYYETKFSTLSFNSQIELDNINFYLNK